MTKTNDLDDLVEKIRDVAQKFAGFGVFSKHNIHRYDKSFKAEIRKLLKGMK